MELPRTFNLIPGWFADEPFRITAWSRRDGLIYCECESPFEWGEGATVEGSVVDLQLSLSETLEMLIENENHLAKIAKELLREFLDVHKCERVKTFTDVKELIRSLNTPQAD